MPMHNSYSRGRRGSMPMHNLYSRGRRGSMPMQGSEGQHAHVYDELAKLPVISSPPQRSWLSPPRAHRPLKRKKHVPQFSLRLFLDQTFGYDDDDVDVGEQPLDLDPFEDRTVFYGVNVDDWEKRVIWDDQPSQEQEPLIHHDLNLDVWKGTWNNMVIYDMNELRSVARYKQVQHYQAVIINDEPGIEKRLLTLQTKKPKKTVIRFSDLNLSGDQFYEHYRVNQIEVVYPSQQITPLPPPIAIPFASAAYDLHRQRWDLVEFRVCHREGNHSTTTLLTEYLEQHPTLVLHQGMRSEVVQYHRRKGDEPAWDERLAHAVLEEKHTSPILAHVDKGQTVTVIQNAFYRAPVHLADPKSPLFLLAPEADCFQILEVQTVVVIGQTEVEVELSRPQKNPGSSDLDKESELSIHWATQRLTQSGRIKLSDLSQRMYARVCMLSALGKEDNCCWNERQLGEVENIRLAFEQLPWIVARHFRQVKLDQNLGVLIEPKGHVAPISTHNGGLVFVSHKLRKRDNNHKAIVEPLQKAGTQNDLRKWTKKQIRTQLLMKGVDAEWIDGSHRWKKIQRIVDIANEEAKENQKSKLGKVASRHDRHTLQSYTKLYNDKIQSALNRQLRLLQGLDPLRAPVKMSGQQSTSDETEKDVQDIRQIIKNRDGKKFSTQIRYSLVHRVWRIDGKTGMRSQVEEPKVHTDQAMIQEMIDCHPNQRDAWLRKNFNVHTDCRNCGKLKKCPAVCCKGMLPLRPLLG